MSVSTDGQVMWWDIRKLSESVESMPLKEKGSDTMLGGVVLEYDPAAGPTNFMVGTEQVRHTHTHTIRASQRHPRRWACCCGKQVHTHADTRTLLLISYHKVKTAVIVSSVVLPQALCHVCWAVY